ncbi:MAG: 23S rRNA (adenine(2503)-C(2))-methyltransferase RlmN [Clostridia bacterium]|nr:23S rRNA (adenine(2503)-C(2))-methyltransferase RlmN [Clostridia bacterium]
MKKNISDYNLIELESILKEYGEKPFRAKQIFSFVSAGSSISDITVIPKELRERLKEDFFDSTLTIIKTLTSKDGTIKFLFLLNDGNVIEGVLMKYKYGNTLCVSTQVGCRMHCAFCASTINGLVRNMSAGEILSEVIAVNKYLGGGLSDKRQITNVVLMGSGEPLDNYDNVVKFIRLLSEKDGLNVSPRNVSLSTSGLCKEMYKLAEEKLPVNLTVSLHNPFDSERKKIMPVANKYSVSEIIKACDNYFEKTGRRYIFEYVLIKDKTATKECADELIRLLKGKPCHVNLIRLNEVKENNLSGISDKDAYRFLGLLEKGGLSATLRRKIGEDIDGACGQLRRRYIMETEEKRREENES